MLLNAVSAWESLTARLRGIGQLLRRLVLRLIMGWEFWDRAWKSIPVTTGSRTSRTSSLSRSAGFPRISAGHWPRISNSAVPSCSWWACSRALAAYSLLVLTFVATAAVHWPDMIAMWSDLAKGYAITDMGHGNFKLPLLFAVMLLPIIFQGPGKISLGLFLACALRADPMPEPLADAYAWSLALIALGIHLPC